MSASVVLVAATLMLSYLSVISGASLATDGSPAARADIPSKFSMASHHATWDDIQDLRSRFGTRSAEDAYESESVDGFGTGLAQHTADEWRQLVDNLVMFEVESLPEALPTTFDLSTEPEFPTVGNQASQGSCAAWAATYYSYGYLEAVDNGWTGASLGDTEQLLSPAWTYNMINGGKDRGSWMDTNMMVIVDWGVATMSSMPYDQYDCTSWGSPEAFREAPLHRASEVGYLYYDPSTTVEAIKALVASGTPVAFAMDANEYTSGFSDGNYIISSAEYSSTVLNHAQTVVGYDDSLSDDSDTGAFRVVNSWGPSWGDSGYYWFTYDALEELGSLGVLYLNFIVDVPDYEPSLVGVWHFDTAPTRTASISVSVGTTPVGEDTKVPFFDGGLATTREVFPMFMCLDMTELSETFWSEGGMHLSIGDARTDGVVSSFRVEGYEAPFSPGVTSQLGAQSSDVPEGTPASVSAYLEHYDSISPGAALESVALEWSSSGQAAWAGVDHHTSGDGDSMQTGDVSDGAYSRLETQVEGPVEVSFDWKVSSQNGVDVLAFLLDGNEVASVSGDVDWESVSEQLGEGTHTLAWEYSKDGSGSSLGDSGWLDSLTLSGYVVDPPAITLADSYLAEAGAEFAVEPASLEHPSYSTVTVWYDWGDSGPWSASTLAEGYAASHVYTSPGTYTLTAYAEDDSGNNVSDSAIVRVLEPNSVPSVVSVSVSPATDHVLPGETVTFDVQVTDVEGGSLTVTASFGDGTVDGEEVRDSVLPEDVVEFSFDHVYAVGADTPYAARFTVADSDEHASQEWDEDDVQVLVNSAPAAALSADPTASATGQTVSFDASGSWDAETPAESLQYRWDWTGDGVWDTAWGASSEASHCYDAPGSFEASVEVMDGVGLTSSAAVAVTVTGDAIPEFSSLVVPVVGATLVLMLALRARGKKGA